MGAVLVLFSFGIGLIGGGFFWKLFDDIINSKISQFIYDYSGVYYVGSQMLWDSLPYVLIFLGIVCLILAALSASSGDTVVTQE